MNTTSWVSRPSPARMLGVIAALVPGILLAGLYVAEARAVAGEAGFPLDDSWIHAQFARNLATGKGFTYTGGEWVAGSTAPAWTILLAIGYFFTRHVVAAAYAVGILAQIAAGLYASRLTGLLGAPRALAAGAGTLVAVVPIVTWGAVSGMEVPLACALVLAGLFHHFSERQSRGPRRYLGLGLLGLSALARPENLAIAAVVLVSELSARQPLRSRITNVIAGALVCSAAAAPLVVFSYATIGRPLPTTFYAKSGPGITRALETRDAQMAIRNLQTHGPDALRNFGLILLDQLSWTAWLLVPSITALLASSATRRVALVLAGLLIVVPYAMGLTAPQRLKPDNVRYAAQLVVLAAPLIVAGIHRLVPIRAAAWVLVIAAIGVASWRTLEYKALYAISVKNIQDIQVATGRWLGAHTRRDAVIAVNDVGAIAYFSERRILDLEGLVSPAVLPYRALPDRGLRTVTDMRPDLVAIFPHWYPDISRSPEFREVHRIVASDNVISAGDTVIIYQPWWSHSPLLQPGTPGSSDSGARE